MLYKCSFLFKTSSNHIAHYFSCKEILKFPVTKPFQLSPFVIKEIYSLTCTIWPPPYFIPLHCAYRLLIDYSAPY